MKTKTKATSLKKPEWCYSGMTEWHVWNDSQHHLGLYESVASKYREAILPLVLLCSVLTCPAQVRYECAGMSLAEAIELVRGWSTEHTRRHWANQVCLAWKREIKGEALLLFTVTRSDGIKKTNSSWRCTATGREVLDIDNRMWKNLVSLFIF